MNRVLALEGTSDDLLDDVKVQQCNYVDDTDYKDEWILEPVDSKQVAVTSKMPSVFQDAFSYGFADVSDVRFTSDGFYLLNKSLSDILAMRNIYTLSSLDGESVRGCEAYYDDWYVYAIKGSEGSTYSLLKMREWEDDRDDNQNDSDSDDAGVSISFVRFDMEILIDCLMYQSASYRDELLAELKKVIELDGAHHSDQLKEYFVHANSSAPYLIANEFINKIVAKNVTEEGNIQFNDDVLGDEYHERLYQYIWDLEDAAGGDVDFVDSTKNQINIGDINNLSYYEKCTVLALGTGDVSYNMFAAEVEFHAEFLNTFVEVVFNDQYRSAMRADMELNEAGSEYTEVYHDPTYMGVVTQGLLHGEW